MKRARGHLRRGLPALPRRHRRDGADFDHSNVRLQAHRQARGRAVRRLPQGSALAAGLPEHAAGLLLLPRRGRRARRRVRQAAARTATRPRAGTTSRSTTRCSRSTTAARSARPPARRATRTARRATPATGATSTPTANVRRRARGQSPRRAGGLRPLPPRRAARPSGD